MYINQLTEKMHKWCITGVAGFIGSNLLEELLQNNQEVIGIDNFSSGRQENLNLVENLVTPEQWQRFTLITGDIVDPAIGKYLAGVDFILHHAASVSVPSSIADPVKNCQTNVLGMVNLLNAACDHSVKRFIYASSSAVYGDGEQLLSPYAVAKLTNENYAKIFHYNYGLASIGLRYFNIYGPRQDPQGEYAAVIAKWLAQMQHEEKICIFGDGSTTRDFCFVKDVVQINLRAALTDNNAALNKVYDVGFGQSVTLLQLFAQLQKIIQYTGEPDLLDFRAGDIKYSTADISMAKDLLGFTPEYDFARGLGRICGP